MVSAAIEIEVEPGAMYENDHAGLLSGRMGPPGPRPWDFCFVDLAAPPVVRWPGLLRLQIESDCPNWVIYDEEPSGVASSLGQRH